MRTSSVEQNFDSNAMTDLLTKYVAGEIQDGPWSQFMELIDGDAISSTERHAIAVFYADAISDLGAENVMFPPLLPDRAGKAA